MSRRLTLPERHDRAWWQAAVARLEASGLDAAEMAAQLGVHRSTLTWWRSRLAREAGVLTKPGAGAFVRVEVEPAPVAAARSVAVEALVGPLVVRVFADADSAWCGSMLGALAREAARC